MNKTDYRNLLREANRHRAQFSWYKDKHVLEITIAAQKGHVWTCNHQSLIETSIPTPSPSDIRDLVQELIESMQFGYIKVQQADKHDDSCECKQCEDHDSELEPELCFGQT